MKPFYVHVSRPCPKGQSSKMRHLPRGFTAFVQVDPSNMRNCILQIAFCSAGEKEFNKKIGREQAVVADRQIINKRDLPTWIGAAECHINGFNKDKLDELESKRMYLLKYVI